MVVPCGADLTTDDNVCNNLIFDEIENHCAWDDDVHDDSWKLQQEEAAYQEIP